jgi:hypothetical protein
VNKYGKRVLALQRLLCECEIILPYEYNNFVYTKIHASINQMIVTVLTA